MPAPADPKQSYEQMLQRAFDQPGIATVVQAYGQHSAIMQTYSTAARAMCVPARVSAATGTTAESR